MTGLMWPSNFMIERQLRDVYFIRLNLAVKVASFVILSLTLPSFFPYPLAVAIIKRINHFPIAFEYFFH